MSTWVDIVVDTALFLPSASALSTLIFTLSVIAGGKPQATCHLARNLVCPPSGNPSSPTLAMDVHTPFGHNP
jgi:hypothetical protein